MKIISSFKDYYDFGQQYGFDPQIKYIREKKVEDIRFDIPWGSTSTNKSLHSYNDVVRFVGVCVGFCGKQYLCYKMYLGWNDKPTDFAYSIDDLDKLINTYCYQKDIDNYHNSTSRAYHFMQWAYYNQDNLSRERFIKCFDEFNKTVPNINRFLANESPIYVIRRTNVRNEQKIIYNAQLKDYGFFKVFDGMAAYQELSMFVGNNFLGNKPIPKIDDKTMAEIKGFDKFSFRKDKKK